MLKTEEIKEEKDPGLQKEVIIMIGMIVKGERIIKVIIIEVTNIRTKKIIQDKNTEIKTYSSRRLKSRESPK